jgi:hypothetical protein
MAPRPRIVWATIAPLPHVLALTLTTLTTTLTPPLEEFYPQPRQEPEKTRLALLTLASQSLYHMEVSISISISTIIIDFFLYYCFPLSLSYCGIVESSHDSLRLMTGATCPLLFNCMTSSLFPSFLPSLVCYYCLFNSSCFFFPSLLPLQS